MFLFQCRLSKNSNCYINRDDIIWHILVRFCNVYTLKPALPHNYALLITAGVIISPHQKFHSKITHPLIPCADDGRTSVKCSAYTITSISILVASIKDTVRRFFCECSEHLGKQSWE